jgi:hypothetical protein
VGPLLELDNPPAFGAAVRLYSLTLSNSSRYPFAHNTFPIKYPPLVKPPPSPPCVVPPEPPPTRA